MVTPESLPEQYLNEFIEKQAKESARLAAATPNPDDPVIIEALWFDDLIQFPNPYESHDYDGFWLAGKGNDEES